MCTVWKIGIIPASFRGQRQPEQGMLFSQNPQNVLVVMEARYTFLLSSRTPCVVLLRPDTTTLVHQCGCRMQCHTVRRWTFKLLTTRPPPAPAVQHQWYMACLGITLHPTCWDAVEAVAGVSMGHVSWAVCLGARLCWRASHT